MIRFYNGKLLTMDGDTAITTGEVWVEQDKIVHVGAVEAGKSGGFSREIDLGGNLLMPGFKNAHTHSAMTLLRSFADDMPLHDWLHNQVFPIEAKLTPEHIYTGTQLAVLEYLSGGVTASFDMYFQPEANVSANRDMGFRTVLSSALNDFQESPKLMEEYYNRYNGTHPLISCRMGVHAEYTTGLERLTDVANLIHKYKTPFFTHIAETKAEVEGCLARYGKTPTELFESLGLFEYGGGGFHCVYLSENDRKIFRNRGLWMVTNPASNLKLASGIAPLETYRLEGQKLAMGTDGAASNNALDMFREMYLATVLQKYRLGDAAAFPAEEALKMATVNSARCMGLTDCDVIAVGKQADMIVIDLQQPNMQPENSIVKNLVLSGSKQNVALTMIAGKIRYEKGQYFVGESPDAIYRRANQTIAALRA